MPIDQFFVSILALIAAHVAHGLCKNRVMWNWIFFYWLVLTAKNVVDLLMVCGVCG